MPQKESYFSFISLYVFFFSLNNSPKGLFTYNLKKCYAAQGHYQSIPGIILISITPVFLKHTILSFFPKKQTFLTKFCRFSTMFHVKHCINGIFLPYSRIIYINIPNSFPILVYFLLCSIYN